MTDVYIPSSRKFGFVRFPSMEQTLTALDACAGMQEKNVVVKLSTSQKRTAKPRVIDDLRAFGPFLIDAPPPFALNEQSSDHVPSVAHNDVGDRRRFHPEFSVKVGNLRIGTTVDQLRAALSLASSDGITDVYIPAGKRFGFVRFSSYAGAQRVLELTGMDINGQKIICELADCKKSSAQRLYDKFDNYIESKLYGGRGAGEPSGRPLAQFCWEDEVSIRVGNLPKGVTADDLCEAFTMNGIDSMTDCYIPPGRCFGFVRFSTLAEGHDALRQSLFLRGHCLELEVAMAQKRRVH